MTNWYFLGVQLDIKPSDLRQIKNDCNGDAAQCKTEVLDFWLRNDQNPTWSKLAQAVEDMGGYGNVVQTLRANYEGL